MDPPLIEERPLTLFSGSPKLRSFSQPFHGSVDRWHRHSGARMYLLHSSPGEYCGNYRSHHLTWQYPFVSGLGQMRTRSWWSAGYLVHAEIQSDMTLGHGEGFTGKRFTQGGTKEDVRGPRRNRKRKGKKRKESKLKKARSTRDLKLARIGGESIKARN